MLKLLAILALATTWMTVKAMPQDAPKKRITAQGASGASSKENKANENATNSPSPVTVYVQTPAATDEHDSTAEEESLGVQRKLEWFTGGLVFVGFLQVATMIWQAWLLRGTLGRIKRQSDLMNRQNVAAVASAKAALETANAFVSSERAWLQVEMDSKKLKGSTPDGQAIIWFRPIIKNYGRTPARVNLIIIRLHLMPKDGDSPEPPVLPPEPDYVCKPMVYTDRQAFIPPTMGISPLPISIGEADFRNVKQREVFMYIYGQVFYRDMAGNGRESRFCNLYWAPPYLGDPDAEGFMTSGSAAPAYTDCT